MTTFSVVAEVFSDRLIQNFYKLSTHVLIANPQGKLKIMFGILALICKISKPVLGASAKTVQS